MKNKNTKEKKTKKKTKKKSQMTNLKWTSRAANKKSNGRRYQRKERK